MNVQDNEYIRSPYTNVSGFVDLRGKVTKEINKPKIVSRYHKVNMAIHGDRYESSRARLQHKLQKQNQ